MSDEFLSTGSILKIIITLPETCPKAAENALNTDTKPMNAPMLMLTAPAPIRE